MSRVRGLTGRSVALLATISFLGAIGVSTAGAGEDFPPVDQPGVTEDEIRVSGVATVTNDPTGNSLGSAFDGVEAYFEYINETEGGVYGRRLVLANERDDQLSNNRSEIQALLSQDDAFAVLPVAVDLFAGADLLVDAGIPTFGWHINAEWGSEDNSPGPPNLFGQFGSFLCFTCAQPSSQVWLAKKLKLENVGVLAYSVPQSAACAEGLKNSFEKYPVADIVFDDESIAFGAVDYSAQVAQMVDEDVDYVIPCIDANGAVVLAQEMRRQGLEATMLLPNAYNHEFIEENAEFIDGNYVLTPFAPFETRPKPAGLKLYERWIERTDGDKNENSYTGWMNADLFVAGLEAAGPDFTQQKVVDAINAMTDYDAGGILPTVDWTIAHEDDPDCWAVSKVVDGEFEPAFGKRGEPFICFPDDLERIPAKPRTAG